MSNDQGSGQRSLTNAVVIGIASMIAISSVPLVIREIRTYQEVEKLSEQVVELSEQQKYDTAIPLAEQVLTIQQQGKPSPKHLAHSLQNLSYLYYKKERYQEAEPLAQQALDIRRRELGNDHLDTAQSLHLLAALHFEQGRYKRAEPLVQQAAYQRGKKYQSD